MTGKDRGKVRRAYRPGVETLEALRFLSVVAQLPVDVAYSPTPIPTSTSTSMSQVAAEAPAASAVDDAWYASLVSSQLHDLLGADPGVSTAEVDTAAVSKGLVQLDRYLARAWYRGGISTQQHDDSTQAVYTTLLQGWGRDRFDQLLSEVGTFGIKDVLSRETADGPDFFRAIDTVKKRAQRERNFQTLDGVDAAAANTAGGTQGDMNSSLQEAILNALSPREAALIQATLQGETPAEIAQQWGIAPKTVSNEKTRALQKLRDALVSDYLN